MIFGYNYIDKKKSHLKNQMTLSEMETNNKYLLCNFVNYGY